MDHPWKTELKVGDIGRGDVLFFVRPNPTPEGIKRFHAGLHWTISRLDGTPFTHVAVVTGGSRNGDLRIAHSDGQRIWEQNLHDLCDEYGSAPVFVSRPGCGLDPKAVADNAKGLLPDTAKGDGFGYPYEDLLIEGVLLRSIQRSLDPKLKEALEIFLTAHLSQGEPLGRRMCAAFAAQAIHDAAPPLAPSAEDAVKPTAEDRERRRANERFYADEDFWSQQASWISADLQSEHSPLSREAVADVTSILYLSLCALIDKLSAYAAEKNDRAMTWFLLMLSLQREDLAEPLAMWICQQEPTVDLSTIVQSGPLVGVLGILKFLEIKRTDLETVRAKGGPASRFVTASHLACWGGLDAFGHVSFCPPSAATGRIGVRGTDSVRHRYVTLCHEEQGLVVTAFRSATVNAAANASVCAIRSSTDRAAR